MRDAGLSDVEQVTALVYRRLMVEHCYYFIVQMHWIREDNWQRANTRYFSSLPPPLRWILPGFVQNQVRRDMRGHGIGRHTDAKINALALQGLRAVSEYLGGKACFMGAAPTTFDAAGYDF